MSSSGPIQSGAGDQGRIVYLERQAQNLSLLMDSAKSIMAMLDLDSLLRLIMEKVTMVMNADRSSLFLVDEKTGELWSRVAQGSAEIRIPAGSGIVGFVATSGETVNIPDAYRDPRFNQSFDLKSGYKTKSILCMPVRNPTGESIGAIQVLNKLDGEAFSVLDEELLSAFSSLAGISIANARAYEELQHERDSLEVRVQERTRDLVEAQKKSDTLLLNILPLEIAEELKNRGQSTARPYELVSVLFTDFKGFTMRSEGTEPRKLVKELDRYFSKFDEITAKHHLEKIKTIGDAYMCAGGLPVKNRSNAVDAVLAALEIRDFMNKKAAGKKTGAWELRIGIHTGPVVAGVVGKRKFAYDIWGDTVNTASRMESSGEPGRVNISDSTYHLIKDFFSCTHRGKIPAKNKGEITMYFVDGIRPELSVKGLGQKPSKKFYDKMKEFFGEEEVSKLIDIGSDVRTILKNSR